MLYGDGIHDDTLALQEIIDKQGMVVIDRPGNYLVSKTLKIHSNTRLVLCPGARFFCAPGSKCAIIENEHFADEGKFYDENIEIVGGIWDGNCDNMGLDGVYEARHRLDEPYSPYIFKGKLMRFAHVKNIVLEKLTVKDTVSYGIQIADVNGFVTRDICFDYNHNFGTCDGVHINGPAYNGVIENLFGTTNDDMVSLTTIDEEHAEVTKGEIANVYIHNISAENGFSGVRLLSAGGFDMRCIHISGVYGDYRHNAVLISHHNTRPNTRIWFDDIVIEHVHAHKTPEHLPDGCFKWWDLNPIYGINCIKQEPIIWVEKGCCLGNLTIRDVTRHEIADTEVPIIQLDQTAEIRRLVMQNISQTAEEGINLRFIDNNATIGTLIERDIER